jgi:hypothetical protein
MILALGVLSSSVAMASSSARLCALAAKTLHPAHVTSMSAVLQGRVTTCDRPEVTAWFTVNGSRGNGFSVKASRRPHTETELLVDLGPDMRVTYRFVVQRGHTVVRGRAVTFRAAG